ncbi:hypothetical protein AGMMS49944_23520 [Spirochaetia bacterium]|nr:hypothetical protein AGMMS49944_23520 [Spirochaetia bacterium]
MFCYRLYKRLVPVGDKNINIRIGVILNAKFPFLSGKIDFTAVIIHQIHHRKRAVFLSPLEQFRKTVMNLRYETGSAKGNNMGIKKIIPQIRRAHSIGRPQQIDKGPLPVTVIVIGI